MRLPFTAEQFFGVFQQYNEAVWPFHFVLVFLALVVVALVLRPRPWSGVVVSAILAFFWGWIAVAYHLLFFSRVNPLAFGFAALSAVGALVFFWWGVAWRRVQFETPRGLRAWLGGVLLVYAMLAYPVLSRVAGHHYPASPTFGLPCPTTIFTLGVLAFMARPYPRVVFVVPVLWLVVGGQAAFLLHVPQDLGLLVAGLVSVILAMCVWSTPDSC